MYPKNTKTVNKFIKRASTSLVIKSMNIKSAVWYHCPSIMATLGTFDEATKLYDYFGKQAFTEWLRYSIANYIVQETWKHMGQGTLYVNVMEAWLTIAKVESTHQLSHG